MHGEKTANKGGKKNWGALILLAAFVMVGAYMLDAVSKAQTPRAGEQVAPRESVKIIETIRTIFIGSEKTEEPQQAQQTPETTAPANASNQGQQKTTKIEGNASARSAMPPAAPPAGAPSPPQEASNTITTAPTRKISDNEYIAGLETDGKVKVYAHEAEGRRIITNDSIADGWYAKIAYDPFEGECFITVYVDADAVQNAQNLTYGCRMRGNIETGCSNTQIQNWGTQLGNLYSYEYEESCAQQATTVKIDGVKKDLLTSGI